MKTISGLINLAYSKLLLEYIHIKVTLSFPINTFSQKEYFKKLACIIINGSYGGIFVLSLKNKTKEH